MRNITTMNIDRTYLERFTFTNAKHYNYENMFNGKTRFYRSEYKQIILLILLSNILTQKLGLFPHLPQYY